MDYEDKADELSHRIVKHYRSHGVEIDISGGGIIYGAERFIFNVKLKKGTREHLIYDRARDIQLALQLPLFHPYTEGLLLRIVVSERENTENSLMKILESPLFAKSNVRIPYAVGYDVMGEPYIVDWVRLHHLIIGGSSGSGKSVALRSLITSAAHNLPVSCVNFIIFDIGANDLMVFENLPHLSYPIVKEATKGVEVMLALERLLEEHIANIRDASYELPAIVCGR